MPKGRDRPILDRMLRDVKNKSRKDVSSNMKDRVDNKTENRDFVYPTEVDDQSTNYENPFVCDYPFEANPVKIGKNFACKLPTNETTQKELSYFETPWLHPYVADLAPPVMYNNVEKNILTNLIGKKSMDQITYINTLGDTNLLPNRCPPYGYPNLIERVEVPRGSKRFVCREPYPNKTAISYNKDTGVEEKPSTATNDTPEWVKGDSDPVTNQERWKEVWKNGSTDEDVCTKPDPANPGRKINDYSKEYYVTWDRKGTCRQRVTNGMFHCPQHDNPEYIKHITLPNGYGMCVLDETHEYNKTLVPFSMLSVIAKDSPFDKKLHLIHNTMIGLNMKKKDIEVFKVIIDNTRNLAEVKALELSLDKALSSDIELNILAQHMANIIDLDEKGNPTLVDAPSSAQTLANYFNSVGTFNLVHQILMQTENYAEVGTVNLLVKHIEVDADLTLAKMAMNTYATTILRLPPIMSITSSDLAFFGMDKSSRSKYEKELKDYFNDLHRLTQSTTDYVPGLAEQSDS